MINLDIRTRLARCFALTFPDLDQSEIERASTTTVATWNSLATITLVTLIEEAFDIRVRAAEIPRFNSYKAILADIESRLGPS
jgi:acyl carrier protein